uniref:Uncharacterized protein n=2 Tax=Caenorhabditis japonica TaxID=281687 RepID=A0A8R1HUG2_CAEJA
MGIYFYDNVYKPVPIIPLGSYGRSSDLSTAVDKLNVLPCGTWCAEKTQKTDVEQITSILSKQLFTKPAKVFIVSAEYIDDYSLQTLMASFPNVAFQQVIIPQNPGVVTYDKPYYTYYQTYYDNYKRYAGRMEQLYPYMHVEVPADQYPFIEQANRYEDYDHESWAGNTCYSLTGCQECMTSTSTISTSKIVAQNVDTSQFEIETIHSGDSEKTGKVIDTGKLSAELTPKLSNGLTKIKTATETKDYEYEITADPPGMKINKTPLQDEVNEKSVSDEDLI